MTSMLDALKKIAAKPVDTTPQDVSADVVTAALHPEPIDVQLDEFEAEERLVEEQPCTDDQAIEARLEEAAEQVEELEELFVEGSGEFLQDGPLVNEATRHDELETIDEESTTHERDLAAGESEEKLEIYHDGVKTVDQDSTTDENNLAAGETDEQHVGEPVASDQFDGDQFDGDQFDGDQFDGDQFDSDRGTSDESDSAHSDADALAAVPDDFAAEQRDIGDIPRLYLNSPMHNVKLEQSQPDPPTSFAERLVEIDADGGICPPTPAASCEPPAWPPPNQELHRQEGQGADTPVEETAEPPTDHATMPEETQSAPDRELPATDEVDGDSPSSVNQLEDTQNVAAALKGAEFVTRLSGDEPGIDPELAEIAQFAFATSTDTNGDSVASASEPPTAHPSATAAPESNPDSAVQPDELLSAAATGGMAVEPPHSVGLADEVASVPLERVVDEPIVPQKSQKNRKPTPFEDKIRTLIFDPVVGTQIAELFENIEKDCDHHGSFVLISTQIESHVSELIGCMALVHALGNKKNVLLVDGNPEKPSLSAGFSLEARPDSQMRVVGGVIGNQ